MKPAHLCCEKQDRWDRARNTPRRVCGEGCSHYYHLPPAQEGRGLGLEWPLSSKEAACCLGFDLLWRSCCYWHSVWRETSHIWIPSWKLNLALEQVTIVSSNPSLLRPQAENVDCEWSKNKKVTTREANKQSESETGATAGGGNTAHPSPKECLACRRVLLILKVFECGCGCDVAFN